MSDEATDPQFAKAESPDEGLAFAVDQLAKGVREHDIRECLIEAGYTASETEEII